MRRTVLSSLALACTAVLAGTGPAFAGGAAEALTARPAANTAPAEASPVPTAEPSGASPAPAVEPSEVPAEAEPTSPAEAEPNSPADAPEPPAEGQVSLVPSGAPDTGVTAEGARSGGADGGGLIAGGAAAVLVAGGAAAFVVRRRRATGA